MVDAQVGTTQKKGRGCLFYGCLISTIITLLLAGLIIYGIRKSISSAVEMFTTTQPMPIPTVVADPSVGKSAKEKFEKFSAGEMKTAFSLTGNEVNQLIQNEPELAVIKNSVFVDFVGNEMDLQVSIPLSWVQGFLPSWLVSTDLSSRYVTGKARGTLSVQGDEVLVQISSGELNGHEAPKDIIDGLNQGLKERRVVKSDQAEFKALMEKLEKVTIENGTLVIKPK